MNYLVELKQDDQDNYILVRETKLDNQFAIVRGWRVRQETHTFIVQNTLLISF